MGPDDKVDYGVVRCTLGLWDVPAKFPTGKPLWQWYSWGQTQINRGPVKRLGASCKRGESK